MSIKFAEEIIKEIEKRGSVKVPNGNVTGEEFEKWLMVDYYLSNIMEQTIEKYITSRTEINEFIENYGEAA